MAFNKWKTGDRLKLEWRYVICPLTFLIVLWVAASFTGHWATEENPYRSYALQACAWLNGRLDLGKDYPWLELAIYEGKYYVSFPPFPSLVLLPFAAVWGGEYARSLDITWLFDYRNHIRDSSLPCNNGNV